MERTFRGLGFILLLVTLFACQGQSVTSPPETALPTVLPSSTLAPPLQPTSPPLTATPTFTPNSTRIQYSLKATLYYLQKTLTVSEEILYTNRSTETLSELILNVAANQSGGVYVPQSATWEDGTPIESASLDGVKLTLPLRRPLPPGDQVKLTLEYQLNLPTHPGILSFGSRQINISGWYPEVVPYIDGQGWLLHPPASVGEYAVSELADFDVALQLEEAPEDVKLAASTPGIQAEQNYHFNPKGVRNFTWSASTQYEVLETTSGSVRIRAFVFPEHLDAGQAALQSTQQALDLYSTLYAPYGRASLTLVESTFTDGIEYDGLYYLGQEYFAAYKSGADNYLTTLASHETAHQWWYAAVVNDQALEPWLDEALCTYSERLFYENEHPELLDWWVNIRILIYEPQGYVNSSIYTFSSFRPYVNAVYLRGAEFLQALREQMGDANFMSFLHDYFGQLQQKASRDDLGFSSSDFFWQIVSLHYEGDLSDLQQTFFAEK